MKSFLASLILILAFQLCFGQEKLKAELLDETGSIDCCYPNFQMFLSELEKSNSQGYIIIYGNKNNKLGNYRYEQSIKSWYGFRGNPKIHILHGKSEESIRIQFWKVPDRAEKPNFQEEPWDYSLFNIKRPFLLYDGNSDDGVCMFIFEESYISKILLASPDLNLNLVIFADSQKNFRQTKAKLLRKFVTNFSVPKNRLRTFFSKEKSMQEVEYWLVPKKKSY